MLWYFRLWIKSMIDCRLNMGVKQVRTGKAITKLRNLPASSESHKLNIWGAHFQVSTWEACISGELPPLEATQNGYYVDMVDISNQSSCYQLKNWWYNRCPCIYTKISLIRMVKEVYGVIRLINCLEQYFAIVVQTQLFDVTLSQYQLM